MGESAEVAWCWTWGNLQRWPGAGHGGICRGGLVLDMGESAEVAWCWTWGNLQRWPGARHGGICRGGLVLDMGRSAEVAWCWTWGDLLDRHHISHTWSSHIITARL